MASQFTQGIPRPHLRHQGARLSLAGARFLRKDVDLATAAAIERLARRFEPALRSAFVAAIRSAKSQATIDAIAEAMQSLNPGEAIRQATAGLEFDRMRDTLADIVEAAGDKATVTLGREIGPIQGRMLASFNIVNPYAVGYIRAESERLIREISRKTQEGIYRLISHAIETGIPPREAAIRIRDMIGLTEYQTNVVLNYENKLIAAGEADIDDKVMAYYQKVLRQRSMTIARSECLAADSLIDGAMIRAIFRRWYEGSVIEVITEDGCKLTTTPNHPMLSMHGWIPAHELHNLDYLVCHQWQENMGTFRNENIKRRPPTISEIFDSASAIGITQRIACREPDFHGDGREGQVDIGSFDRPLRIGVHSSLNKEIMEQVFPPSDFPRFSFCSLCACLMPIDKATHICRRSNRDTVFTENSFDHIAVSMKNLTNIRESFTSFIKREYFRWYQVVSAIVNSTAIAEEVSTSIGEGACLFRSFYDIENPTSVSLDDGSYFSSRQTSTIQLKRLESVRIRPFRGHVFNLSTDNGYFISNGFYTGNTLRAANGGQQAAWQAAVDQGFLDRDVEQRWLITRDERLCPEVCEPMPNMEENNHVKLGGFFLTGDGRYVDKPPAHPKCIMPDTEVESLENQLGFKSRFKGFVAEVKAGPRVLTVGPNHPILTMRGFIPAIMLNEGDYVLCGGWRDRESFFIHPDKQNGPSSVEQIFKSLEKSTFMSSIAVPPSPKDFHGDGDSLYSDIEIVRPNCLLRDNLESGVDKIDQCFFEKRDLVSFFTSYSQSALMIKFQRFAASAMMSRFNLIGSLLHSHSFPFNRFGGTLAPWLNAITKQSGSESTSIYLQFLRQLILAFAVNVTPQRISKIRRVWYSGHIYDLQSFGGLYFANGIVATNCRCGLALNL